MQVLESLDLAERVERRWELSQHSPYAHLAQDDRLGAADTLLELSFAGPCAALATIQLGFPPLMYTEVLSLLRVRPDAAGGGADPRWMVVGSSCCSGVPYLVQESIPIAEATLHTLQPAELAEMQSAPMHGSPLLPASPLAPMLPMLPMPPLPHPIPPVVAAVVSSASAAASGGYYGSGVPAAGGYAAGGDGAAEDPD